MSADKQKQKMELGKIVFLGIIVSSVLISVVGGTEVKGLAPCNFPAIYNFGDSNSDTGGYSATIYPQQLPSGETFFKKATGRLSDGRLTIDFLAEHLRLPYLNSYLDSIGTNFSHGANFAVGFSSIREQNYTEYPCRFHLDRQATHYMALKNRTIELHKQGKDTSRIPRPQDFSKALHIIDIGHNDLQNDFIRVSLAGNHEGIIFEILNELSTAVKRIYEEGARIFWIHNVGPIGCLPSFMERLNKMNTIYDENGCAKAWNELTMEYNRHLKERVIKLREELPEATITYVDVYNAKYGLISNAKNLGFTDWFKCCYVEKDGKMVSHCANPSTHIYWDGVLFTEAANRLIAESILNGSLSDPPLPITYACHKHLPM